MLDETPQLITLVPNETGVVRFYNYPKPSLLIRKVDSVTGDPLQGAKFHITYASNNTSTGEINDLGDYFTDANGTKLLQATRTVVYNTNISMEKLVMEQLIKGPNNDELFPTINPETKVNNVTVKDGICYVNLNESFLTPLPNATSEVTIYSITNSLVELPNINKVQISVNGDTSVSYKENMSLSTVFERNLELVENGG